ncbi:MAG: hypothetical protein JWR26_3855 [Pedosphaera sp.]|nr:hypothetical protein [Pedosphaera sp.]
MKSNTRWIVAFALISGACFHGTLSSKAADSKEVTEWKPSCDEVGLIQVGDSKKPGALKNFCLNSDGNILACFAQTAKSSDPKNASGIRVYSPKGELLKTLPLEIKPTAICVAKDGSIFAAGDGRILKLDSAGKVLASAASPVAGETVTIGKETEDMVKQMAQQTKRPFETELASMKQNLERRRADVTGLATTGEDVFMAVPAPSDFTYRVYRFSAALENPKLVVEKLRGCCGQMDVQAHDGKLWIPHNARHAVESLDRDGKELTKFGKAGKVKATDFGGCCEPKNMRVLPNGDILAAESGPPTCIKRFSASGEFKEVVAVANNTKGDCVRVTVEMSPDGHKYYMLDTTRDAIRIFAAKN